jgi:hypothetical protein
MNSAPKYQLNALQELASGLPKLMKICLYRPHLTSNEIVSIFKTLPKADLSQLSDSVNLTKTYQLEEHGPHIKDRRAIDFNSVNWEDDLVLEEEIVG